MDFSVFFEKEQVKSICPARKQRTTLKSETEAAESVVSVFLKLVDVYLFQSGVEPKYF